MERHRTGLTQPGREGRLLNKVQQHRADPPRDVRTGKRLEVDLRA
jgi:hypothetical protein